MLLTILIIFLLACLIATVFALNAMLQTLRTGLPFVSTPRWAVIWLKENLQLKPSDVVYELGSGSAMVMAVLARRHPDTKFVGMEIQWWPHLLAKWRCRKLKNVVLVRGDVFRHNLSPATTVYGFYITNFMARLEKYLDEQLRPGTTVVSYGFNFPNWKIVEEITNPAKPRGSKILIYRR